MAREAIFKYSEIDLSHEEADEIAANFVGLFFNKSIGKVLEEVTEQELDELAGVGLWDLLDALCISREAYKALADGGDPKALKSASIIQRRLSKIGASSDMIEFCSQQKVAWDIWVRDKRHNISPFDFNLLQEDVQNIANGWNGGDWTWLPAPIPPSYTPDTEPGSLFAPNIVWSPGMDGPSSLNPTSTFPDTGPAAMPPSANQPA